MCSCVPLISNVVFIGVAYESKMIQGILFFGDKKAHFFEPASKVVALMGLLKQNGSDPQIDNGHFYKRYEKSPAVSEGLEVWVENLCKNAK